MNHHDFFFTYINFGRLEDKFLDMETENQVLRQQSLLDSSVKTMSEHLSTHVYEVNGACLSMNFRILCMPT